MIPIVRREDNIRIIQHTRLLQLLNKTPNHLIDSLQRAQPSPSKLIIILNKRLIQLRQVLHPPHSTTNGLVEARIARDLVVIKQVRMARRKLRLPEPARVAAGVVRAVRVRRRRRDGQEPGLVGVREGLVEEAARLVCDDVCRVLSAVADGLAAVAGHLRIVVAVGVGVEEEVGAIEALGVGAVVVGCAVRVPELANVVGVVAGFLEPDREVVVVPAGFDDAGVAAVRRVHVGDVGVVWHAAGPDVGARGAAEGCRAVVLRVGCSFLDNLFLPSSASHRYRMIPLTYLKLGHIIRTPHMLILVICQDKQDIGLAGGHGQPGE